MTFIHDNFLLSNETSIELYHEYAAQQPIIDYHNHLPPSDIAKDRRFTNLGELWLEGDHYKWRAMRANGIDEQYCTGAASDYDKFLAFAKTIPFAVRNPLYHWSHLELKRFFDIDELINERHAAQIWEQANAHLQQEQVSTHTILRKFKVTALCTTDDPTDSLQFHRELSQSSELETQVLPAFRPDKAMFVDQPDEFNKWVESLAAASDTDIGSLDDFLDALRKRHDFFHECGARLSDHGMEFVPAEFISQDRAAQIFTATRTGVPATEQEHEGFSTFMLQFFAELDALRGWTKQFHVGVVRNNNTRLFKSLGRDIGCDSMSDRSQVISLGRFLDQLDQHGKLPKTIVYNLNPNDNYAIATMLGNFQDGRTPGKMQLGSGWWYLDQMEGMQWQMNAISNVGLLPRFVGMLTDSRSFMSFTRHEYFRRILCDLVGRDVQQGLIPRDTSLLSELIERICYRNAKEYLGIG